MKQVKTNLSTVLLFCQIEQVPKIEKTNACLVLFSDWVLI